MGKWVRFGVREQRSGGDGSFFFVREASLGRWEPSLHTMPLAGYACSLGLRGACRPSAGSAHWRGLRGEGESTFSPVRIRFASIFASLALTLPVAAGVATSTAARIGVRTPARRVGVGGRADYEWRGGERGW